MSQSLDKKIFINFAKVKFDVPSSDLLLILM